jgi:hypothetical protein
MYFYGIIEDMEEGLLYKVIYQSYNIIIFQL